jgi:hypothetical protein
MKLSSFFSEKNKHKFVVKAGSTKIEMLILEGIPFGRTRIGY